MKSMGPLLVICSLTYTGFCLSCKSCLHSHGVPCDGPVVPCSPDQVCVAFYSVITTATTKLPEYELTCRSRSLCNVSGSMNSNHGKVRTGTSCCDTDDCIPPFPTLPPVNLPKNGLTCRTSVSGDAVECTGDEIKCGHLDVRQTGTVSSNNTLLGCATRSYCEILGNHAYSIQKETYDLKMSCSDGAVTLHVGLLGPAVATLLTKILLYSY